MIYLFTGNNEIALEEAVKKWKKVFLEKYGDFNFVHIKDLSLVDTHFLAENLLGSSFFWGKKFILIEDYPWEINKDEKLDSFFLDNFEKIPEENILLFVSSSPDKLGKVYKKIAENGEIRDFAFAGTDELRDFLLKKYMGKIAPFDLDILMRYKAPNVGKIVSEMEKLLLTKEVLKREDIEKNIAPEIEENIFMIVDNILNKKKKEALEEIKNILHYINIYAFYNALLGNIRNRFYIDLMRQHYQDNNYIATKLGLWKKAFLVGKHYKINFHDLQKFYFDLIYLDKKMKFGKMLGSEEKYFLYEIERVILRDL